MNSIDFSNQLLLRRTANIQVIVTQRWKEEMQVQLQQQIAQLDAQMQQVDAQGSRQINEIERQSIKPFSVEVSNAIEGIRAEMNRVKSEMLDQKNQLLTQLTQVQNLALEQEVSQGQLDSFFPASKGDNLIAEMRVDIVLRDGVIEDIRKGFPAQ
ncbi:MAG: YlqD family protein [Pseudanabaenaceae cyanobacterium bins.39]|nr:YlqD family protein [Pseudanabaenaceae cyanobacterium bins.39]